MASIFKSPPKVQELIRIPELPGELLSIQRERDDPDTITYSDLDPDLSGRDEIRRSTYKFHLSVDVDRSIAEGASHLRVEIFPYRPDPPPPPKKSKQATEYLYSTSVAAAKQAAALDDLLASRITTKAIPLGRYISTYDIKKILSIRDSYYKSFETVREPVLPPKIEKDLSIREFTPDDLNKGMTKSEKIVKAKYPFVDAKKVITDTHKPFEVKKPLGAQKLKSGYALNSKRSRKKETGKKGKTNPTIPYLYDKKDIDRGALTKEVKKVQKEVIKKGVDPAIVKASKGKIELKVKDKPLAEKLSKNVYIPPIEMPPPISYYMRSSYTAVNCIINIDEDDLGGLSEFFVRVAAYSKAGVRRSHYEIFSVPHAKNVNTRLTPRVAPGISAAYRGTSQTAVTIQQRDFYAERVKVFRRLVPASDATTDVGTKWEEVFDAPMERREKTTFTDDISYHGMIVYRALAYGPNQKPSEDFSSAVVKPIKKAKITTALTATADFEDDTPESYVEVRVTDIPTDGEITSISLQRFDLTYDSARERRTNKGKGFVYIPPAPGSSKNVLINSMEEITFQDTTVERGRSYRYVPVGQSPTVGTVCGVPYTITVPPFVKQQPLNIEISSPVQVLNDKDAAVTFDINSSVTDFGFSKIRDSLSTIGLQSFYDDQISKNRENFEKIVNFTVVRENLKNGDQESFGIVKAGSFVDSPETRKQRGISEPQKDVKYNYKVTAFVNTSDYLFPLVEKQIKDKNTLNLVKKNVSKLSSPFTKNTGVIPSTAKQFDQNANDKIFQEDPRLAGKTNITAKKDYLFPLFSKESPPDIGVEEYRGYNRIFWTASRDDIDHFQINLVSKGGSMLIDTVHFVPEVERFEFRHYGTDFSVEYAYEIVPILISYKPGPALSTETIPAKFPGSDIRGFSDSSGKTLFNFPPDLKIVEI